MVWFLGSKQIVKLWYFWGEKNSYPIWKLASSHLQWAIFLLQLLQRVSELLPSFLFQSGACKQEGCSDYIPTWSEEAGSLGEVRWHACRHRREQADMETYTKEGKQADNAVNHFIVPLLPSLGPVAVITSPSYKVLKKKAVIWLWRGKDTSRASGMQRAGLAPYLTQNEEKQLSERLLTGAGYRQPLRGKLVLYWPFCPPRLSYSSTDSTVRFGGG